MKSVLILSQWHGGGVAFAAEALKARGLRSVLVSAHADDRNRDRCDEHVLFDWTDPQALIALLDERDIDPIAIVNTLEPLIPWQMALAAHYGLPGAEAGRNVLLSKTLVRDHVRKLGLSGIRYTGDLSEVDFFPAIVKPARESGSSWLVRRVNSRAELHEFQRMLNDLGFADTELIAEEYIAGTEFSIDGPVADGRFHPVLTAEKPEHDDVRHHDRGLRIHPVQQDHVRAGVHALVEVINAVCADLGLDQLWLHVEGRTTQDGRAELVEINPRPGGGLYPAATRKASGIDVFELVVAMSLAEFQPELIGPLPEEQVIGWYDVEARTRGTVEVRTTEEDLLALPGVFAVDIANGIKVVSLEKENHFLRVAVTAGSRDELDARVAAAVRTFDYRIVPPPS